MVIKAILFYLLSIITTAAIAYALVRVFAHQKKQLMPLHIFFGAGCFLVMVVIMLILMRFVFSENAIVFMTSYFPEAIYKIGIALMFFAAVCAARYFILNAVYFNRDKSNAGESFLAGYGICGAVLVSVYCLFMLITVICACVRSNYVSLGNDSTLLFKDGTVISVFLPLSSHFLITLFFALYTALCTIIGEFMNQHANLCYKAKTTFIVYSITAACELIMAATFVFAVSSASPVVILIVAAVLVALAVLAVRLLYKYKEELPYEKQFD